MEQDPAANMFHLEVVFREELEAIEKRLLEVVGSDLPQMDVMVNHIIASGGKRIRPLVMLLTHRLLNGNISPDAINLAVAFELIHTATLIHDDINDGANRRRGVETLNCKFGNAQAIVVGDYLFVKGFEIGGQYDPTIVTVMARACSRIAAGEILQLEHVSNVDLDPDNYFRIIRWKTAEPIAACAKVGAMLAGADEETQEAFYAFGLNVGLAFQIVDDLLDYIGDDRTGKPTGLDLGEGKMTLPIIHALGQLRGSERDQLLDSLTDISNNGAFPSVVQMLDQTGSFKFTRARAAEHIAAALKGLEKVPGSDYKDSVVGLADFVLDRVH